MTLWLKRAKLSFDTNLNAYLYTVAKNNCLKRLRDVKYRNAIFQSGQSGGDEIELNTGALGKLDTSELIFSEIEKIIQDTMQTLSPQCRQVFELSSFSA